MIECLIDWIYHKPKLIQQITISKVNSIIWYFKNEKQLKACNTMLRSKRGMKKKNVHIIFIGV